MPAACILATLAVAPGASWQRATEKINVVTKQVMANLSAIVAAKAQAQKLRQIAADGEPGLGNRNQVGAGAETHLERTSRNGAVVKVRRESTHAVPGDCAVPVGVSTSEAPQVPAVAPSFTQGVRAALSSLIPASSKSAWYSSARTSSGTDTGYDESPATLQLIAAVLEVYRQLVSLF